MMKTILLSISLFLTAVASAQKPQKAVIKTPNACCEECKDYLESRLSRGYDILSVVVNYSRKTTTVTWLADRTNIEEIKAHIANLGFDADEISADEKAYKSLPACCKRPTPKITAVPVPPAPPKIVPETPKPEPKPEKPVADTARKTVQPKAVNKPKAPKKG
jgi:periplasmic mercuric ion binding protein